MDDDLNDDTLLYEMAEAWRKCHSDHPDADTLGRRYGHLKTIAAERMRLAAAARPEQVTLAMAQGMIDSLDYHAVLDYCGNIGVEIDDDSARYVSDCLRIDMKDALAALPWPQGSGALHPLPKEGWREVDDALAASTQDAQTEVDSDE